MWDWARAVDRNEKKINNNDKKCIILFMVILTYVIIGEVFCGRQELSKPDRTYSKTIKAEIITVFGFNATRAKMQIKRFLWYRHIKRAGPVESKHTSIVEI